MKIFIINSGSSSIKFQLIDFDNKLVIAKGLCERIGLDNSKITYTLGDKKNTIDMNLENHSEGINEIINILIHPDHGVIKDKNEITAVGHRVVHAGENFSRTVILDDEKVEKIRELIPLAPLHNPPNIIGIEAVKKHLPGIPMTAVFDTAFHQTMPEYAYMYPIPYEYYEERKIRRYGFHGTSHFYVAKEGAKKMGKPLSELKIITCHLGNGSSMAAVKYGKSVDTTMGFTPLEGLMMGTRCGDIDPAIALFLQRAQTCNSEEVNMIFNRMSGIKGISGVSSDMRDIEKAIEDGNERAQLALDMFTYRIKKYLGAYIAAMNGVDLIIFTAGIGERDIIVREKVLLEMDFLGIHFDKQKNDDVFGEFGEISADKSPVRVMVIPTNEELEIAEQTVELINNGNSDQ
ncbi:MAG: acetate kinase [Acidobacteriota bacterium]